MDERFAGWAEELLRFPPTHPYTKFDGAHWRLVELADLAELGVAIEPERLRPAHDPVLEWIESPQTTRAVAPGPDGTRPRRHASQEGNLLFACTVLGWSSEPRVVALADVLLSTQWPDGGWNCDRDQGAWRSSFHETVTPALGLAWFARTSGRADVLEAAHRAVSLLLEHRLYRRGGTGSVIHPSWTQLHYPPYWHYDILQGLRVVGALGMLDDGRADNALALLRSLRDAEGGFPSRSWASRAQPAAVDYGHGRANAMLNRRANDLLAQADGASP